MTTFVFVILNIPVGANVGPTLTLTSDVGVVIPNTATVAELVAGFLVEVDVLSTTITVTSEGLCVNSIDLTMPTTTTTTTASLCHCLSFSYPGIYCPECIANISYIDCNGDLIEDRITQGGRLYQDCGNTPTADNVDVIIGEAGPCIGGTPFWECAPCTTDKCLYFVFPVSDTHEANITYTDCNGAIYQDVITSDSINAYCGSNPTCDVPEVIIIESGVVCTGKDCFICKCHTIYNPGTSPAVVSYINCTEAGNEYITTSINGGVVITVCAIPGTISAPLGVVVTNLGTDCTTPGECI